jgi:hypothetical protein
MKRTRPILAELFRQVRDQTQNVSIRPHFSKPQFVSPENILIRSYHPFRLGQIFLPMYTGYTKHTRKRLWK